MTTVILFHHAQGLTPGIRAFADELAEAGHRVTVPDLYDGATFNSLEDGVAYAEKVGFDTIVERGRLAVEELPGDIVYAGFSLGVMPAQMLTQTRAGARGAVLLHGCVPPAAFGTPWPAGVPAQIHAMDGDELLLEDGDLDAARQLAETTEGVELFLYPGAEHLFTDSSLPAYDEAATELVKKRVIRFLGELA